MNFFIDMINVDTNERERVAEFKFGDDCQEFFDILQLRKEQNYKYEKSDRWSN